MKAEACSRARHLAFLVTQKATILSQLSERQIYRQSLKKDRTIIHVYFYIFNWIVKVEVY